MISAAPFSKTLSGAVFGGLALFFDCVGFAAFLGVAADFAEVGFALRGISEMS